MQLLLVEDEPFTRNGILSMVPWEELGIEHVTVAIDGEDGLEKASHSAPDIILTDVKMPHMDGVNMSFKIRELYPSCCIIFMSGYADKEYLKSAILLSAINYIEKPFSPDELISTLRIAVEKCQTLKTQLTSAESLSHKLDLSLPFIKNEIALLLLRPNFQKTALNEYLKMAYPDFDSSCSWITFLIQLLPGCETFPEHNASGNTHVCDFLESHLALSDFAYVIIGQKTESLIVIHINLKKKDGSPIFDSQIGNICYTLCDILKSTYRFLLITGHPVTDFENIYLSYQAASISLQRAFFFKENSVIFYEESHNHLIYEFPHDLIPSFEKALYKREESTAFLLIQNLVKELRNYDGTLVSTVKNYFFSIARCLYHASLLCDNHIFSDVASSEDLRDTLWKMSLLSELDEYIHQKLSAFFHSSDDKYSQYPLAYKVRLYINENLENTELSLQLISQEFSVSESYICTIFKKAFSVTLNQYIINQRIEKAKEYLTKSNKKIKEISELVGYRDSNYFIRLFKKITGLTPADYRLS